jgi:hypothetical protein
VLSIERERERDRERRGGEKNERGEVGRERESLSFKVRMMILMPTLK